MKIYKIYINDNALHFIKKAPENTNIIQVMDLQDFDFQTFYKDLGSVSEKLFLLECDDPKEVFKKIKKSCVMIRAAGGLVKNAKGDYLFIFRNKKWDLPKGKAEKGEKIKAAALREVEEECGVKVYTSDEKLCKTYHVYTLGNKTILKKTNWYSMTVKGEPKLIPQKEEGITKACWVNKTALKPIMANTYPSILEVMAAGKLLFGPLIRKK